MFCIEEQPSSIFIPDPATKDPVLSQGIGSIYGIVLTVYEVVARSVGTLTDRARAEPLQTVVSLLGRELGLGETFTDTSLQP